MNRIAPAQKITLTLFINQGLGSSAYITMSTIGTIMGARLSGNPALAGAPAATVQIGTALASVVVSLAMERLGRRKAIFRGMVAAAAGAALALAAVIMHTFIAYLAGLALVGFGQAAMQLGRFAAAEVHPPAKRGTAISNVVLGGTAGSIFGPLLVSPAARLATGLGLEDLAGPFMVAFVLLLLAATVVFTFLKPDPQILGKQIALEYPEERASAGPARGLKTLLQVRPIQVAVLAMVLGQVVMVMLMGITSLHMQHHQHDLSNISIVISSHTFGMFAFSILSGRLADWWGRGPVILTGGLIIFISCVLAPLSPNLIPLSVSLFLLGLGWNFCYVGGSTLLSDQLSVAERTQTQGVNDLFVGFATAAGSLSSGVIFAGKGYGVVGMVGAALILLPLVWTGWWMAHK